MSSRCPGQGATFVFELPLAGTLEPDASPQLETVPGQVSLFGGDDGASGAVAEPPSADVGERTPSGVG